MPRIHHHINITGEGISNWTEIELERYY
jgi:hypothetical protein